MRTRLYLLFTCIVFLWYAIFRWYVYSSFIFDKDTHNLLVDPFCNLMAVISSVYLFNIIIFNCIKNHFNLAFKITNTYNMLCLAYGILTIILFCYHAYSFGWFIHDLFIGSNTIKMIDFCLDPLLLFYFSIPTKHVFLSLQKLS